MATKEPKEKDEPTKCTLPWERGLAAIFPNPPKKIAGGLNHSASISNIAQDRSIFLQNLAGAKHAKAEVYTWGRNSSNVLGLGHHNAEKYEPTLVAKDVFKENESSPLFDAYEVACGANHTMILMTRQDEKGGESSMVLGLGLGHHGRLGVQNTGPGGKDESWCTEDKARRVEFEGAYRVVDKPKDGPKTDGVYYHLQPDRETRDRKSVLVWGSNVHGTPTHDKEWLRVDDPNGTRYLPMIQDSLKLIMPVDVQILRIACGADHTLAFATTGVLYAWGLNTDGQCGVDAEGDVLKPTPVAIPGGGLDVAHFACGSRHSALVDGYGGLWTWGCGQQGRLGIGKTPNCFAPQKNTYCGDTCFRFVACGEAHSGGIDSQEHVWTWGAGAHGRLGHGETVNVPTPSTIEVLEETKVKQLALGGFHSLALTAKPQKVYTWGMGHANGQSPDGKSHTFHLPQVVNLDVEDNGDGLNEVIQIAAGSYHSIFLFKNGRIMTCGLGLGGRLGLSKPKEGSAKDVGIPQMNPKVCGYALKIKNDATMCYFRRDSEKVVEVKVEPEKRADGVAKVAWDIEQIACGHMHSVVRTSGGAVFAWGDTASGQLGVEWGGKQPSPVWVPKRVPVPAAKIVGLAVGAYHCLAVTDMGGLLSWGRGDSGQLGTGRQHNSLTPERIDEKYLPGLVIAVAASDEHSGAIVQGHEGNSLFMWGNTDNGKLGLGKSGLSKSQPTPKEVESSFGEKHGDGPTKVPIALDCGPFHTLVIIGVPGAPMRNGEVWGFGGGLYGRLGIEDTQHDQWEPKELKELNEGESLSISCGSYHSAAILTGQGVAIQADHPPNGELWVWGRSKMVCEIEHCLLPKKFNLIEGTSKFSTVCCGTLHTLVVMESGVVHSWGENNSGQLGLNSGGKEVARPDEIKNIPGAVMALATGAGHSLALLSNGDLYAWGNQSCGRLGLEDKSVKSKNVFVPSRVKGEWASIEEITVAAQGDKKRGPDDEEEEKKKPDKPDGKGGEAEEDEDEGSARMLKSLQSGQKVQYFMTMQSLLKNEKQQCREPALKKLEDELTTQLTGYLKDIMSVPEKERVLLRYEADLSQGLGPTLRELKKVKQPDPTGKVNPKVASKLTLYEELMWVLQQQPCYMASLATCSLDDAKRETYKNVVKYIYAELEDSRTLHLFMAMMKLMIDKEVEKAKDLQSLFSEEDSMVFAAFKTFALHPVHFQGVVWPFMDALATDKQGSVYAQVVDISKKFMIFALTRKEFAAASNKEERDPVEEMNEFMQSLVNFKEFMLEKFEKSVMGSMLHPNLRKLLYHAWDRIKGRNFQPTQTDQSIPAELVICEPLLKLVFSGILIPQFKDPDKFGGSEVYLAKARSGYKEIDETMGQASSNMKAVGAFLEEMMKGGYDKGNEKQAETRQLALIAKQVKQMVLKYVKEQADFFDDTETHTTIDVYTSHYDRNAHIVSVPTMDLLNISNVLLEYTAKVRQTDDDPCVQCCEKIGKWDDAIMEEVSQEGNNLVHNFVINSRFVLNKGTNPAQPLIICRTSDVPMPARFCATYSESYVKRYIMDQPDSQCKVLEDLFREIDELKSNKWSELKDELENQLRAATAKNPPNFVMAHKLTDGIRKVDELASVDSNPMDILHEMSDKLLARSRHRTYLEQVLKGLHAIKKAKMDHQMQLKQAEIAMQQIVTFSITPKMPDRFRAAAGEANLQLRLERVRQRFEQLGLNRRAKLEGCTFSPTGTFELSKLQKDAIVTDVNDTLGNTVAQKTMSLTFAFGTDGGVDLAVNMKKNKTNYTLRQLKITPDQIQQFKKSQEGDTVKLPVDGEALLAMDACKLSKLLTAISTGAKV